MHRRGQLGKFIKNPHKTYLLRQLLAQINSNNKSFCCCTLDFVTYLRSFFEHVLKHRFGNWERHLESFPSLGYTVPKGSWVMIVPSLHVRFLPFRKAPPDPSWHWSARVHWNHPFIIHELQNNCLDCYFHVRAQFLQAKYPYFVLDRWVLKSKGNKRPDSNKIE